MKRRLLPIPRIILVVLVCLLAGAIVNVAVAWGLAIWGPPHGTAVKSDSGWQSDIVAWWRQTAPAEYGTTPLQTIRTAVMGYESIAARGKRSRFERHTLHIERRRYGWPMRSLECTCWADGAAGSPAYSKVQGIQFQMSDQSTRVLPTVVRDQRFAINTVFYAVIVWLLFIAPFALRRRRRIKRGLCPKCAYDLRGQSADAMACPECGAMRLAKPQRGDSFSAQRNALGHDHAAKAKP